MTREQILERLASMEWTDELFDDLERAAALFVVYQEDPDDHHTYLHERYLSEAEARADYESRTYVPSGRWCYCVLASLHDDAGQQAVYERRKISDPYPYWD